MILRKNCSSAKLLDSREMTCGNSFLAIDSHTKDGTCASTDNSKYFHHWVFTLALMTLRAATFKAGCALFYDRVKRELIEGRQCFAA